GRVHGTGGDGRGERESAGEVAGIEVPHLHRAVQVAGARLPLREVVDGGGVAPDEDALVGAGVGRDPTGHADDLLVLAWEPARNALREGEGEVHGGGDAAGSPQGRPADTGKLPPAP